MTVDEIIINLDNAMKKSRLKQDVTVYRGLSDAAVAKLDKLSIGATLTEKGYVFASVDPVKGVYSQMVIKAPKGARVLHAGGPEIIIHRDNKMKLVGVGLDYTFDLVTK